MSVRLAGPGDCADLAALCASAFERPFGIEDFSRLISAGEGFAVCADAPSLGYCLARIAVDEAEVLSIAVAGAARGQGLGRALLGACLEEAKARGAARMFLEVAADNPPALALYRRMGFETCGRRPKYYPRRTGEAADALVLARNLTEN